ncbi:transcriptional regulator GutM [Klenkia brasiliensis]|uniref:Glucitol operon activator protein (GutM) n=1 Tax=Klenkia brasiliensis TaxID=333142 RepID=A0A1G7M5I9_9ACTN|nr:transcriptional regulator GutM [Klenkia brasiliensis]SDF57028.1 Glucitol operon activator protein (GutM) [Klenkia brasiliensis]
MSWAFLLIPVVLGSVLQLWLTSKQTTAWAQELRRLRPLGATAVGRGGKRYRGGVAFVAIAVADKRITGAFTLRGVTTFARPAALDALVGVRLSVVAGDRPIEGLTQPERAAARQAAEMLRAALAARPGATSTTGTTATTPAGAPSPA